MIVGDLFQIDMEGLRAANGRFASSRFDPALVVIQEGVMHDLASDVRDAFHDAAPYREPVPGKEAEGDIHEHFRDSFSTDSEQRHEYPYGFTITLDTNEGDVAGYLRAGEYPIWSNGPELRFWEYNKLVKLRRDQQPVRWFTAHQDWEVRALAEIAPACEAACAKIAIQVDYYLTQE